MQQERERRKQLVAMRRKQQEANVEKKRIEKEVHRLATAGAQRPKDKTIDDENDIEKDFEKAPREYDDASHWESDSDNCQSFPAEDDYGLEDEFSDIEQKGYNSHGKDDYNADNL